MKKKIKITETGYESNPATIVGIAEGNQVVFESSLFRGYLRLTKAQARKLGNFLLEFGELK